MDFHHGKFIRLINLPYFREFIKFLQGVNEMNTCFFWL